MEHYTGGGERGRRVRKEARSEREERQEKTKGEKEERERGGKHDIFFLFICHYSTIHFFSYVNIYQSIPKKIMIELK